MRGSTDSTDPNATPRLVGAVLCIASAMLTIVLVLAVASAVASDRPRARCHEGQPCFCWRRGIVTKAGRAIVVDSGRFDSIVAGHRIDWTRTARLRCDERRR
jgi:hypothetical protein